MTTTLSSLLPSTSYTLAYTLPLLFVSLILTFSGTFLTLDRSRHNHVHGGIGGIASGYAFAVHIATLLALLIPSTTDSAPLSPNSFVALWILSSVLSSVCAARFRIVALILPTLSGGILAALFLSVLIHPPFLARHVLLAIFTIALPLLLILASSPRCSTLLHPLLRFSTTTTGTFGIILSIAILASPRILPWANIWERLWVRDGAGWGTGIEKALNAAFCLFWCAGLAVDWALRRWVGECPDEKWDRYLADYSANLPNSADRQGVFEPLPPTSLWDRIFSQARSRSLRFDDDDDDLKLPPPAPYAPLPKLRKSASSCGFDFRKVAERRERKPVKFGDLSEEDEEDEHTLVNESHLEQDLGDPKPPLRQQHRWEDFWRDVKTKALA